MHLNRNAHVEIHRNVFDIGQFIQFGFVQMDERLLGCNKTGVHLKLAYFDALRTAHALQRISGMIQCDGKIAAYGCIQIDCNTAIVSVVEPTIEQIHKQNKL